MDPRIQNSLHLMQDNFNQNLPLVKMAQAVNLSASRFRHLFKAETGLTPAQHLQRLRMEQAKHLLETTFMRVKEIAYSVGMSRDVCLVRQFRRVYGMAPARYRACYISALAARSDWPARPSHFC